MLLPATGGPVPALVATAEPLLVTGLPPVVAAKLVLAACKAASGVCPDLLAAMYAGLAVNCVSVGSASVLGGLSVC